MLIYEFLFCYCKSFDRLSSCQNMIFGVTRICAPRPWSLIFGSRKSSLFSSFSWELWFLLINGFVLRWGWSWTDQQEALYDLSLDIFCSQKRNRKEKTQTDGGTYLRQWVRPSVSGPTESTERSEEPIYILQTAWGDVHQGEVPPLTFGKCQAF